jgi:adenylate cyclase
VTFLNDSSSSSFRFGRFLLLPHERQLLNDGCAVWLEPRTLDLLIVLVENAGRLVVKDRLLELVWPGVVVDESNLYVQVSTLRKILGAEAISTVSRQGYRFALEVTRTEPKAPPPSIAVLPFVNRSVDEEDEYFTDGLVDEIINVLGKIRGLRVAARSSVFTFKGKQATVGEVGRALNVSTVLDGSVRKSGNRMRITVQLAKAEDGYHLWSETYDRSLDDIFAVQDSIAQSVVQQLRTTLLADADDTHTARETSAQVAAAVKGRTADAEAHRLFLQGRYFLDRRTQNDTTKGIDYLRLALDRDPGFALAWAELGRAYGSLGNWEGPSNGTLYRQARESVDRSLALEPDLVEGHARLISMKVLFDWDWRGAEMSYRRALELAPDHAVVLHEGASLAITHCRFDEAIELSRRAVQCAPLSSEAYHLLGYVLDAAGRRTEAEPAYRKAIELAPQCAVVHALLALNLLDQGRGNEALVEALCEPVGMWKVRALAVIHHAAGRREEADAALSRLIEQYASDSAYQVAEVCSVRGEPELAFDWLDRAYAQHDSGLSELRSNQRFRPLHCDQRWSGLLRKLALDD